LRIENGEGESAKRAKNHSETFPEGIPVKRLLIEKAKEGELQRLCS